MRRLGTFHSSRWLAIWIPVCGAILAAILIGWMASRGSRAQLLLFPIVVFMLATAVRYPEWWVALALVSSNSIFKFAGEESYVVSLFGYGLKFHEAVILGLVGLVALQRVVRHQWLVQSRLDFLIVAFVALVALFMARDVVLGRGSFSEVFATGRGFFAYLLYFPLVWGIRTANQLRRLMVFILILATVTALIALAQFGVGTEIRLLPGISRVETLTESPSAPTRVLPIGLTLIMPVFLIAAYYILSKGSHLRGWTLIWLSLLSAGLLISFTRSIWMGSLAGLAFVVFWSGRLRRNLTGIVVLFAVLAVGLQIAFPVASEHALGRFYAGFGLQGYDLDVNTIGRIEETRTFFETSVSSAQNIIWGAGMRGNLYVNFLQRVSVVPENGYMHLFFATGLVGMSVFSWMCVCYFVEANRVLSQLEAESQWKMYLVGFAAGAVALLVVNVAALVLTVKPNGVIVMALAMALPRLVTQVEESEQTEARRRGR